MNIARKHIPFTITPVRLVILLALLQLLVALFTNSLTLTHEESMWHYIGRNWFRHGLVPYTGGVDNKSPLIYFIFGWSDRLFGVNYWFPRLLGTIVEATGVYYLFKLARHLAGDRAGLFAISVYGLSLLWRTTGGKLVSFTETYTCTAVIISFYYTIAAKKNRDYFISAVFAGIALAFRLTSCFGILAILLVVLRQKRSAIWVFAGGVLLSLFLAVLAAFLAGIDLSSVYYYMVTDNFGAGSTTDHSWAWKMDLFSANFFNSEMVIFYPFVTAYVLIKKKIDGLIIWMLLSFIGINVLGIYARPHFKELLPPLSLMTAWVLDHGNKNHTISYKSLMILAWICFFPKSLEPLMGIKNTLWHTPVPADCKEGLVQATEEQEKLLGLWIKSNSKETDKVFVAGYGARVQVFSEKVSPTIYFNVTQTERARQQLYKDLESAKPEWLVIPAFMNYENFVGGELRGYIDNLAAKYYRLERCMYGYSIYKLK